MHSLIPYHPILPPLHPTHSFIQRNKAPPHLPSLVDASIALYSIEFLPRSKPSYARLCRDKAVEYRWKDKTRLQDKNLPVSSVDASMFSSKITELFRTLNSWPLGRTEGYKRMELFLLRDGNRVVGQESR